MGQCLAGICGGSGAKPAGRKEEITLTKPAFRLDEEQVNDAPPEFFRERFGMEFGPPDADPPIALVTENFRKNANRLLALIPSAGAPFGSWDTSLPDGRGGAVPLMHWAEANNYAVAIFSSDVLRKDPAAWDRILAGSPARHVVVLVATGELETLHTAMEPVHELLYARTHVVSTPRGLASSATAVLDRPPLPDKPQPLREHLFVAQAYWPEEWAAVEPKDFRQRLFQFLLEKELMWQEKEASKYCGLRNLKENDVPGLRRIGLQERVDRLSRDRNTDELARLIDTHAGQARGELPLNEDDDEPGVD